eukprot:CAMPEP_0184699312 /NCGR_PEP_ID=MMETSP0313-20130426/5629_1 /TAXON_ID=2792 /ORGANISM="Porphyridium aerugineum, Strain SAG 1380-2" /LENGTH=79 /DNA_ID=CAMNT_0027158383 /DNA_START=77 /DNA_END=312 /DNA_ORIENTATION=-
MSTKYESYGMCGIVSCSLGALTMFLFFLGFSKEYKFFGYNEDMGEAATSTYQCFLLFLGLGILSLASFIYGKLKGGNGS